jgi:biopolymer transport protein ExbD
MRRFSQKNHLVTLNDINITPLLDLAFVLLIIFIITTPLLEQNLALNVPAGGAPNSTVNKNEVRTIEVHPMGGYVVMGRTNSLADLEQVLRKEFNSNPKLAIYVRADSEERYKNVYALMDLFREIGISRVQFAGSPKK